MAFFSNLLIISALLVSTIANGYIFELIHFAVTHRAGAIYMVSFGEAQIYQEDALFALSNRNIAS